MDQAGEPGARVARTGTELASRSATTRAPLVLHTNSPGRRKETVSYSKENPPPSCVRAVVTANGGQLFGIAPDGHVMSTFWSGSIPANGGWHDWFAIPTGFYDGKIRT
jgi:hypothetical protein